LTKSPYPRSLAPAFARHVLRICACMVVIGVIAYLGLTRKLERSLSMKAAVEQAEVIAAGLIPGPGGDLAGSVDRMQARCDRLLAVATLDVDGGVHTVFPERRAYREALHQAGVAVARQEARSPRAPTAVPVGVSDPLTEESFSAIGVMVPLPNDSSAAARRVAVLLRSDQSGLSWIDVTTWYAAPLAAGGLFCFFSITGWFDRRVAGPLRDTVLAMEHACGGRNRRVGERARGVCETSEISLLLDHLLDGLAHGDAERRRVELAAAEELRDRESAFERQLDRVRDRVHTDSLTKLRNRAFLEERLEHLFELQKSEGTDMSAVLLDLDNFKRHNDALGHQAGDDLLKFVGELLRGSIRDSDCAVRYGGDEFLLLLPGANEVQASAVAERIVKTFGQHVRRLGVASNVSLSAGVATVKSDGCGSGHELVAQADAALYAAKRVGKNTVASGGTLATALSR
jgi:diguanylate cyclase (GGDEF)-like protein